MEQYVNLVSRDGDRPLHCVAKNKCLRKTGRYSVYYYDYEEEEEDDEHTAAERMVSVILSLVENGAHLDAVNKNEETIWDYSTDLHQLLPPSPRPLACLASKVIVDEDIPYQNLNSVPPRLKHFINLHNPDCCLEYSDCVPL